MNDAVAPPKERPLQHCGTAAHVEKIMSVKTSRRPTPEVSRSAGGRKGRNAPKKAVLRPCTPEEATRLAKARLAYVTPDKAEWRFHI